ncbi:MAG: hypothetical protein C4343_02455 [Chloroflexota bacterium]
MLGRRPGWSRALPGLRGDHPSRGGTAAAGRHRHRSAGRPLERPLHGATATEQALHLAERRRRARGDDAAGARCARSTVAGSPSRDAPAGACGRALGPRGRGRRDPGR